MPKPPREKNKYNSKQKAMRNAFAKRLRKCREDKKLSHEKLSESVGISKQALINYEIADEYNTRYESGFGANITFLFDLADYFNVSTDYLRGRTNDKKGDRVTMELEKRFGLDVKAINNLESMKARAIKFEGEPAYIGAAYCIHALNLLLEHGVHVFDDLATFFFADYKMYDVGEVPVRLPDLNDNDSYYNPFWLDVGDLQEVQLRKIQRKLYDVNDSLRESILDIEKRKIEAGIIEQQKAGE